MNKKRIGSNFDDFLRQGRQPHLAALSPGVGCCDQSTVWNSVNHPRNTGAGGVECWQKLRVELAQLARA